MFKKILLPISALAVMALVACDETTSASNEPASSSSVKIEADDESSSSVKDESSSSSAREESSSSAKEESSSSSISLADINATCEILKKTDELIQVKAEVADSASMMTEVSYVDGIVKSTMSVDFAEAISDADIKLACEAAQKEAAEESGVEVTCKDRNITMVQSSEDPTGVTYPMVAGIIEEYCNTIQESGEIPEDNGFEIEDPTEDIKVKCDISMDSDVWTMKNNSGNVTYTFKGDSVTIVTNAEIPTGSEAVCKMALEQYSAIEEEGSSFRCEGANLITNYTTVEAVESKQALFDEMNALCSDEAVIE